MLDLEELRIIRAKEAQTILGLASSTFYDRVNAGLLPPNISLGGKTVGWVASELNTVIKAMISGKSKQEIKQLVEELKEKRLRN